jgi:hypothetical protein
MATYSFSQGAIQTAYVQYQAYELTNDLPILYLVWPSSYSDDPDVVANFMQVTATPNAPTVGEIIIPDATQVSVGMNFFINNTGAANIIINDIDENQIAAIVPGDTYAFYLTDNSTPQGTWLTFEFGANVSTANASALAGEGLLAIGTTLNTTTNIISTGTLGTVITEQNRADLFVWTGGGGNAFVFPETGTVGNGFYFSISNQGQGSITLTAPDALIDGGNVTALDPQISCYFITNGTNWYTIGRGQPTYFSYFVGNIAVSAGDKYLTENEANKSILNFTGALTADVTVFFPQIAYSWYISNLTTENFKLYVVMTGSASSPIEIPQSERMIFYSDNVNIYSTPTIILPEAGFIFPDGTAENPSITFVGDNQTGAFLNGQNMAITQNGNLVCDFSYDAPNQTSIIRSPGNNVGLAVGGDLTNQFNFKLNSIELSTLTAPSAYGANPVIQTPYLFIKPTNNPLSLGALRIGPARTAGETFPNTTAASISGVNSSTGAFSALGIFSNLINISTSGTNALPEAPNTIVLYGDQISLTANNSVGITTPTLGITSNATITGNLNVTGNINNFPAPLTYPIPVALGGIGANNKITGFNNLSPLTTAGDLLSFSGGNNIRIPNSATNGKNLISRTGNYPAWNGLSILNTFNLISQVSGVVFKVNELIPISGGNTFAFTPKFANSILYISITANDFYMIDSFSYPGLKMQFSLTGGAPWTVLENTFSYGRPNGIQCPAPISCSFIYSPATTSLITFSFVQVPAREEPPLFDVHFSITNLSVTILEIGGN